MYEQRQRFDRKPFNKASTRGGEPLDQEDLSIPHTAVQAKFLEVQVFGNFDRAMRTFRALVQKEGILSTYKERGAYEKPSDKRRRKKNEAIRKIIELELYEDKPGERRSRKKRFEDD